MIKRTPIYTKAEPSRSAGLFWLFCEGERKERHYFNFWNKNNSRILVAPEIIDQNNSPVGLYKFAEKHISSNDFRVELDQVWLILDTDNWPHGDLINVRDLISNKSNWFIAQSNPCFEVWLYYHHKNEKPPQKLCTEWKNYLNDLVRGGFQNSKHACLIETAIINSAANFSCSTAGPDQECTEVHFLAEKILPLVKPYLDGLAGKPILV